MVPLVLNIDCITETPYPTLHFKVERCKEFQALIHLGLGLALEMPQFSDNVAACSSAFTEASGREHVHFACLSAWQILRFLSQIEDRQLIAVT